MMQDFYNELDLVFKHTWIIPLVIIFLGIGCYTDITRHKLYRSVSFAFMGISLITAFIGYPVTWMHVAGALAPFVLFTAVGLIFNMQVGGDVFFITALGFMISFWPVVSTIIIACVAGLIYGLIRNTKDNGQVAELKNVRAPFGPFMAIGCITTIVVYFVLRARGF